MGLQDEFSFINKIKPSGSYQSSLITGIGDDAALYSGNSNAEEVVCMDTMVDGIHFNARTMKPYHIGYKALAANISDLAAMGAEPTFYLVSIAVSTKWSESQLLELFQGMRDIADQFQMDLIGGDTVSTTDATVLTVTALGRVEKDRHLLRSNARSGDVLFITGTPGDSACGLSLLLDKGLHYKFADKESYLVSRHQMPAPRVHFGRLLASLNCRIALNDISDGVASEAHELAEASNRTLVIEQQKIPYSDALLEFESDKRLNWFLNGGEDFELIGTIDRQNWPILLERSRKLGISLAEIGYVEDNKSKVLLKSNDGFKQIDKKGYNHFKK